MRRIKLLWHWYWLGYHNRSRQIEYEKPKKKRDEEMIWHHFQRRDRHLARIRELGGL